MLTLSNYYTHTHTHVCAYTHTHTHTQKQIKPKHKHKTKREKERRAWLTSSSCFWSPSCKTTTTTKECSSMLNKSKTNKKGQQLCDFFPHTWSLRWYKNTRWYNSYKLTEKVITVKHKTCTTPPPPPPPPTHKPLPFLNAQESPMMSDWRKHRLCNGSKTWSMGDTHLAKGLLGQES